MKSENLQQIANIISNDLPPSEQLRDIAILLVNAGVWPEAQNYWSLRNWPTIKRSEIERTWKQIQ